MEYLAHIAEDGRRQTVEEHLKGTGEICKTFAKSFNAAEQGEIIGALHDIGKYTKGFQARLFGGKRVDHSSAGALKMAMRDYVWGAMCIAGHHGGLPDFGNQNDGTDANTLCGRFRRIYPSVLSSCEVDVPLPDVEPPIYYGKNKLTDSFIIRMLFSCLVDADFLDTESFMQNGKVERGNFSDLSVLLHRLNKYTAKWGTPKNELNRIRSNILQSCISAGSEDSGLFSLTVPTGGGKTVSSLAFALNHAQKHSLQRIIYVVPYTSIIEQNAKVFREILGEENVVEHHSNINITDDDSDISPEKQKLMLATENWDAPVIVTTAVQFFESVYSNKVSACRKLHNIANSVVVFDEAQMMPIKNLRPCVAAICAIVSYFNTTAVLCTATQPSLDKLINEFAPYDVVREICPKELQQSNVFRRVSYDLQTDRQYTLLEIAEKLAEKTSVLCIVNKRKTAQEIYELIKGDGSYHLSTLMYPEHRRKMLDEIRDRLKNGLPCRVVSTSLIEAGVDVDFRYVYREIAGLDSILQAAGRCNREGKCSADESIVTVFALDVTVPVMIQKNIGAAKEALASCDRPDSAETIKHYFDSLLDFTANLDSAEVIDSFKKGIQGCELPFRTVSDRFHMIDNITKAIYVPIGEGEKLIHRLNNGERSKSLFRQLGQYAVNVYDEQYDTLYREGSIVRIPDCDCAYLAKLDLYDEHTGLKLDVTTSTSDFKNA